MPPSNVSTVEQLSLVPRKFLSGDETRPLLLSYSAGATHSGADVIVDTDADGSADDGAGVGSEDAQVTHRYLYALEPMTYSVKLILLMEALERFTWYGLRFTITAYLTGVYDSNGAWNAGFDAVSASSLVSMSGVVAYTAPFVGGVVADSILGDYGTILLGTAVLYIPGLILIASTTIPNLIGSSHFNVAALVVGLAGLEPAGAGMIKSVVNVFGAKQYHPVLQSSLIETYYVSFYICINVGALVGGFVVPVVAQHNITVAYFIPVITLTIGLIIFKAGKGRYVHRSGVRPRKHLNFLRKSRSKDKGNICTVILAVAKVTSLIVPFTVAYSQIITTFIIQGTVMEKALGWIDAPVMVNCDATSVLCFGYVVSVWLYPLLAQRGIRLRPTDRFATGSLLGALAILWALVVEQKIHEAYKYVGNDSWEEGDGRISILWQGPSFVFIGAGEIFAIATAYETAYAISPPQNKALASAVNLFFVGAVPNFLCIGLYQLCRPWFCNDQGNANITQLEDYVQARVGRYFAVLLAITLFGVGINLTPGVRRWMASIEKGATEDATDNSNLEMTADFQVVGQNSTTDEDTPLLCTLEHAQ